MAEYESLAHLSRWRRVVIWFCEDKIGLTITTVASMLIAFGPAFWLGMWWFALVIVAAVAFTVGWNAARRRWLRDGHIDKL